MDKLKKEIEKMVYDYSINNKIADKNFVADVIELCVEAFDIKDYVKDYDINSIGNDINAGYDPAKKHMIVDLQKVLNGVSERLLQDKYSGIKSTVFEDTFKINSTVVYGNVHELTHACQYKECLEGDYTLQRRILELNLDRNLVLLRGEKISLKQAFYYKSLDQHFLGGPYYEACPSERMADMTGLKFIKDITTIIDPELKGDLDTYNELRLLNSQINGYNPYSPTTFVTLVNETLKSRYGIQHMECDPKKIEDMYRNLAKKHNLSFDERIWYGLPITEYEKQKVYSKRQELQKILLRKE